MLHKILLTGLIFSAIIPMTNAQFLEHDLSWEPRVNTHITAADTDGDGDLDIFGSSYIYGQNLTENIGGNSFAESVTVSEEGSLYDPMEIDIDVDGDIDFVCLKEPYGIAIFENIGDNEFTKTVIYEPGVFTVKSVGIQDINLDGLPDISFILGTTSMKWLENNGDGTFTVQTILDGGTNLINYCHFDADGDADADICIFELSGTFLLCENLGASYASPVVISSEGLSTKSLYAFDEDADGDEDIIYTKPDLDEIRILRNYGDGTFAPTELIGSFFQPFLIQPMDLDNDGNLDLLMYNQTWQRSYYWKKNLGDGEYAAPALLKTIKLPCAIKFADVDGDEDLDLLHSAHEYNSLVYYENEGDGVFSDLKFISQSIVAVTDIAFSDMDNDGDLDLFCVSDADKKISMRENLEYGNFGSVEVLVHDENIGTSSIVLADLNGDLREDLVLTTKESGRTSWYENLGDGNFGTEQLIADVLLEPVDLASADFDGDGDHDILVAHTGVIVGSLMIYENEGGSFDATGIEIAEYAEPTSLNVKDLDEDGDLDIAFVSVSLGTACWMENLGDLTFTLHVLASDLFLTQKVSCADMDDDGDSDLIVVCYSSQEVFWIENLGTGAFNDKVLIPLELSMPKFGLGLDMNNDGLTDLMIASENGSLGWYENTGDMVYSERIEILEDADFLQEILPTDLDMDGDIDFLKATNIDFLLSWMENMLVSKYSALGKIFIDDNENGVFDLEEEGINFATAFSSPESYFSYTDANGNYKIVFDEAELGDYTVSPAPLDYWYITTASSYDITVDGADALFENLDFGFYPSSIVNRVDPSITGATRVRIDTEINLHLSYTNTGSTIPSGSFLLELCDEFTYLSSEITPELIDGQNISWSYTDLGYFESVAFNVTVLVPGVEFFGDTVISYLTVAVDSLGDTIFTNTDSLEQVITAPYDPNDKSVRPVGTGPLGYIAPETETLEYLIRFQNTGTDYAEDVVVKDQLDNNLDWLSLRPISWSHPMEIEVDHYGEVSFIFEDIMLPDSNANELESHGFVKFEIDLMPGLPLETSIYNTASIYFDANPAIVTNTTVSTLHEEGVSEIMENETGLVTIYPNPFSDFTTVRFANGNQSVYSLVIYNLLGVIVYQQDNITSNQVQIRKADLGSGIYILNVVDTQSKEITDQVKIVVE